MKILEIFKEIEQVVDKNQSVLKDDAESLKEELSLGRIDELEKQVKDLETASKTLTIGIVGRVKAGKSSLLNALLFDGKSILPKAATPMTASLTLLSYDEKISAEVEFYTQNDIENIKQKHDEYLRKLEKLKEEYIEKLKRDSKYKEIEKYEKQIEKLGGKAPQSKTIEDKAEELAKKDLSENYEHLQAAYEHYEDMFKKGSIPNLDKNSVITANTLEELSKKLLDYVGSQGRYTPYTKSVRIKVPIKSIEGIEIVDTPGINDPVVSREERTRELLKNADVVFVVSNTGQFLSEEDLDLMDRITMREGIRELFLIGSQVDLQLHGDEKLKSKGNLYKAIENIKEKLSKYTQKTLRDLKRTNPEVGDTYDQLIEDTEDRLFLTSGACYSIYKHFDDKNSWDNNMKKVWENLTKNYPDFFSEDNEEISLESLKFLSGMDKIVEALEKVKEKKKEILKKRSEEILRAKSQSLRKYVDGLVKSVEDRLSAVQNTDIKDLEENLKELQKKIHNAEAVIEDKYDELVEDLIDTIKENKKDILRKISNAVDELTDRDRVEKESYITTVKRKKGGVKGWFLGIVDKVAGTDFGTEKVEEIRYRSVLRTGPIERELVKLVKDLKMSVEGNLENSIKVWRRKFRSEFTIALRNSLGDELLDIGLLTKSIASIEKSNFKFPSLRDISIPDDLRGQGVLRDDDDIESYFSELGEFLDSLEEDFKDRIDEFIKEVKRNLQGKGKEVIKAILDKYRSEVESLKKDIENKQFTIDRLNKALKDLKDLKRKVLLEEA